MPDIGLAPNFSLAVNGTQLSENTLRRVLSASYEDNVSLADKISIALTDPDMHYIDSKILAEGNLIELAMGYENDLENMQAGIITSVKPRFPTDGPPTLVVDALDGSAPMMDTQKTGPDRTGRNYKVADSEIASQIFKSWGYGAEVDATPSSQGRGRTHKRTVTDWKFLLELAGLHGYEVYVNWDFEARKWIGHFKKTLDQSRPQFDLKYAVDGLGTLTSFNPEWSLSGQSTEIAMAYYDEEKEKVRKLSAKISLTEGDSAKDLKFQTLPKAEIDEPIANGSLTRLSVDGQFTDIIVPKNTFPNEESAIAYATAWLKARRDSFVHGEGSVVGHPSIRTSQVNNLLGIGVRLSGLHYFTKTAHKIDKSGYSIAISTRKVVAQ